MAILVHAARATRHWVPAGVRRGGRMYHGVPELPSAEGTAALIAFVRRSGLRPQWIQYPGSYREHFDARADDGLAMLAAGARLATNREVGMLLAARKRGPQP